MKKTIMVCAVCAALFFACGVSVSIAGVEPVPWMPEINKIHSIELNVAAIQKRLEHLAGAVVFPEGTINYLDATANQTGVLNSRLANVLAALPSYGSLPAEDQEEINLALGNIRVYATGASRLLENILSRMGVEPVPWRASLDAMVVQVNGYLGDCTAGTSCTE